MRLLVFFNYNNGKYAIKFKGVVIGKGEIKN